MKKVFVLGIDGAFPEYIFDKWLDELPNLRKIINEGSYAKLNSTCPPLSAVAWSSIFTGKSPSDTGIFEYIYRVDHSYEEIRIITANKLKEKTIWQIASENNKKSVVCFLNLTWPIKPFKGYLIGDPLTPSGEEIKSTYPAELKKEIINKFGKLPLFNFSEFRSSKSNFREMEKEQIINEVYELTEEHIEIMKYLLQNKEWDLFFGVIGTSDRMNHAFWKFMDKYHRGYKEDSKFINTLKEFYIFLDKKIGELIDQLDEETKIIILSDHGIMRMHTRVNLTDWLIKEGYMFLKNPIQGLSKFNFSMVDWQKTKVFAIGAYEGQIYFNLEGREPQGIVKQEEYNELIEELNHKLKLIKGDKGEKLDTKIFIKKVDYDGKYIKEAPDIIVYFDNLQYGCNNSLIGNKTLWSPSTAKGSDDATHSLQGIFIIKNGNKRGNLGKVSYLDVAPTILNELELDTPKDMKGRIIS